MTKTVFITGSSTGIGKATALYFQEKGWNVSATMRTPSKEQELTQFKNVICPKLDVTDVESIKNAIKETIEKFGDIDVIVNNAGYGLSGAFEGATEEQIKKQFDTNVFGVMSVIREILPLFRKNKKGLIINVTSMGGKVTFPLYSLYHSSKWALEGFSESLQYELAPFNIKVKIIEPGAIKTDFYDRSADFSKPENTTDYDNYVEKLNKEFAKTGKNGAKPIEVAKVIYKASTDNASKLRYTAGFDAKALIKVKSLISDEMYIKIVKTALKI
ncbi:MAG: SDR family oxidoreductase [Cyanobacteriota bacterium]